MNIIKQVKKNSELREQKIRDIRKKENDNAFNEDGFLEGTWYWEYVDDEDDNRDDNGNTENMDKLQ
jgi:hypothetical protein